MAAVDGGSTVLLDVVSCGCVAVRAGFTTRDPEDVHSDGPVAERVGVLVRQDPHAWWRALVDEYAWGLSPELPAPRTRNVMALWADAARSLLEYHAARSALGDLAPGDILLLDGALEEDPSGLGLTASLLERARERNVIVLALSKDSARSIQGMLPFPIELEDMAARTQGPRRFMVDVTQALKLTGRGFRCFGVRWDATAPVMRVDLPDDRRHDAAAIVSAVGAACNDPSVAGYPYPLARIHRRVRFAPDTVIDLRRSMEALVSESRGSRIGMRLFGRGRDVLDLGS
jgi:hypothetical protein